MTTSKWFLACAVLAVGGCIDGLELSETSEPIMDFGATPLNLTWMKASHNTYQSGNTPDGQSVAWHFDNTTNHIEIDIRDTWTVFGKTFSYSGDWMVAHTATDYGTPYCGGSSTLTACLQTIANWHYAHPGHALLTVWLDKKQDWQGMDYAQRSPVRLDAMIYNYFGLSSLVRPGDISTSNLRAQVQWYGWPTHAALAGKVMFIMTSDANGTGNARLRTYVDWHQWNANSFVAPYANTAQQVYGYPDQFSSLNTPWVAIYNFEWRDWNNDGECDDVQCYQVPTAHDYGFLSRVWDVDDSVEADMASYRPFGGVYGHANFIPVNHPWQHGGDYGYGNWPDGIYPW